MAFAIKDATGRITPYGFSCGYMEHEFRDTDNRISLFMEHGVYIVRGFVDGCHVDRAMKTLARARRLFSECKASFPLPLNPAGI